MNYTKILRKTTKPKVVIEWLILLLRVREVKVSAYEPAIGFTQFFKTNAGIVP
jgi:hypothetical protein